MPMQAVNPVFDQRVRDQALAARDARIKAEEDKKAKELAAMEQRAAVPGAEQIKEQIGQQQQVAQRFQNAPNTVPRTAAESTFRSGQDALIAQLQARASGMGPSLEDRRIQADAAAARNRAFSQAAGARPGMEGLALRQAAQVGGQIDASAMEQAAQARMAERQAAEQMLAQVLQGARGQDQSTAQFNAGQGLAADQLTLQRQGMGNELALGLGGQAINLAGLQQQGGMSINAILAAEAARRAQQVPAWQRFLGAGLGLGGALLGGAFGGPAGAMAGGQLGNMAGGAIAGGGG